MRFFLCLVFKFLVFCFYSVTFNFFKNLPIILPIILAIAFFTLWERKILGSIQRRRGPNVVGLFGLAQALIDGIKLVLKETVIPSSSNNLIFLGSSIGIFFISLLGWAIIPFSEAIVISDINLGLLLLFAISSLGIYGIILSGWASNSKYSFLGAIRSTAQMISYEVSLGLLIMPVLLFAETTNLTGIILAQQNVYLGFPLFFLMALVYISILAETNRLPFDLPEAESELVSGYNVEYSAMIFAFFFLAEYSNMILLSTLVIILFWGGWIFVFNCYFVWCFFALKFLVIIFSLILVRATFPRYRYDQLMLLGWKVILPWSLFLLFFFLFLKLFWEIILI